jgi:hypothetical protein
MCASVTAGLGLPEWIGRLGLAEIALVVIVADAVVAEVFLGVALSPAWTIGGHRAVPSASRGDRYGTGTTCSTCAA